MLVISRKKDEEIVVGDGITVTVLGIRGNQVQLGIKAPPQVPIVRGELRVTDSESGLPEPDVAPPDTPNIEPPDEAPRLED